MQSVQLLVAVYSEGFGCSVFTIEETIDFCDKLIEHLENPPYEIIEVSLMSQAKVDDIQNKLWEFSSDSGIYRGDIVKIILAVIYKKYINNEIEFKVAIKCIYKLLVNSNLCLEEEYYDLFGLDDSYDLAESQVYGDLYEVAIQFKDAVSRYESYYKKFEELIDSVFE